MATARRLSAADARQVAAQAARLLANDSRVSLVCLFGSAAHSGRGPVRDVDLAILTDPPVALVAEFLAKAPEDFSAFARAVRSWLKARVAD